VEEAGSDKPEKDMALKAFEVTVPGKEVK